ncbi:MAG: hypothetical protein M3320_05175 [Actinomycetota bacterium]|nr:hypothetical protein [Actinomycetota bacterium]MDQ5808050.1 hypothetical protein [Actinomycetota bacterium]
MLKGDRAPRRTTSIAIRAVAAPVAVTAVALAILGTDGLHRWVGETVLRMDVGEKSPGEGTVEHWGQLTLVAVAFAMLLIRGVWADFLAGICAVLVVAAVVGHGQDVSEVARLSDKEAQANAERDARKAKEKEEAAKAKDGPPDVVGARTRFTLPAAKLQPPGEDVKRGAVTVLLVVAERGKEDGILRREGRRHPATLGIDVPAAGTERAVPVDVEDARVGAFAADLASAEAVYLLNEPTAGG